MDLKTTNLNIEGYDDLCQLGRLYERYGYVKLKMSQFEKYDFYVNNKYFVNSSGMITFTDINGELLALKPDNTFSIARSLRVGLDEVKKIYYYDGVYRTCGKTKLYEKVMQYGVECIGSVDLYNLCEIFGLAAESLGKISNESVLNVSHLEIIMSLLKKFDIEEMQQLELFKFIEGKNVKGIKTICKIMDVPEDVVEQILILISAYGPVEVVIPKMRQSIKDVDALKVLDELEYIVNIVQRQINVKIIVDMSITMGYMNYYDGVIFKGFVKDSPSHIIMGGQYNRLMRYFNRSISAVGFGVYLNSIKKRENKKRYDVDIFVLYNDSDNVEDVYSKVRYLVDDGNVVLAGKNINKSLRVKKVINFSEI